MLFGRSEIFLKVAIVVLGGNGKAFCTGGDLSVFPSLAEHQECLNWLAHDGYGIGKAIELCEKVVIAKVTGHCLAGGLELALMCDLVLCAGVGQVWHGRDQYGDSARMGRNRAHCPGHAYLSGA